MSFSGFNQRQFNYRGQFPHDHGFHYAYNEYPPSHQALGPTIPTGVSPHPHDQYFHYAYNGYPQHQAPRTTIPFVAPPLSHNQGFHYADNRYAPHQVLGPTNPAAIPCHRTMEPTILAIVSPHQMLEPTIPVIVSPHQTLKPTIPDVIATDLGITQLSQVSVCLKCGDEGFSEALIYCNKCQIYALHRYCLDGPVVFTRDVTWFCEDCEESSPSNTMPFNTMTASGSPCSSCASNH